MTSAAQIRTLTTRQGPGRAHLFAPTGTSAARGTVVMGHGAGGGVESADLHALTALTEHGWTVCLLEQPWRVAGRRIAVAPPKLDEAATDLLRALDTGTGRLPRPWVLGGRSAGARVACRLSAHAQAVCLIAFPLRPPRKPTRGAPTRIGELMLPLRERLPVLVVQGTRDRFGGPEDLARAIEEEEVVQRRNGDADVCFSALTLRSYPGDHGPTADEPALLRDIRAFLDALP